MGKISKSDILDKEQESETVKALRRLNENKSKHFTIGSWIIWNRQRYQINYIGENATQIISEKGEIIHLNRPLGTWSAWNGSKR